MHGAHTNRPVALQFSLFAAKIPTRTRPPLIEIQQIRRYVWHRKSNVEEKTKLFNGRPLSWSASMGRRRRRGWRQVKVKMAKSSKSTVPFARSLVCWLVRSTIAIEMRNEANEWPVRDSSVCVCARYAADETTSTFVHEHFMRRNGRRILNGFEINTYRFGCVRYFRLPVLSISSRSFVFHVVRCATKRRLFDSLRWRSTISISSIRQMSRISLGLVDFASFDLWSICVCINGWDRLGWRWVSERALVYKS